MALHRTARRRLARLTTRLRQRPSKRVSIAFVETSSTAKVALQGFNSVYLLQVHPAHLDKPARRILTDQQRVMTGPERTLTAQARPEAETRRLPRGGPRNTVSLPWIGRSKGPGSTARTFLRETAAGQARVDST